MLWAFKKNKNATERAKEICSVYGQGIITDRQVRNLFFFIFTQYLIISSYNLIHNLIL